MKILFWLSIVVLAGIFTASFILSIDTGKRITQLNSDTMSRLDRLEAEMDSVRVGILPCFDIEGDSMSLKDIIGEEK